ncbi:MAG: hypothetical protein LBD85_06375 [Oscillospiraceae bacterium]|nr:hypothetical protein [Oscillospiraceae bacterium]
MKNNEMVPNINESDGQDGAPNSRLDVESIREISSSDLPLKEKRAKIMQIIAEYEKANPEPEPEKEKTLSEEYRDVLKEMAERDGVTTTVEKEGMSTILQYGDDIVRITNKVTGGSLVGERGPIYAESFVTKEDSEKAWFREVLEKVGIRVNIYPETPPNE